VNLHTAWDGTNSALGYKTPEEIWEKGRGF